MKKLLVFALLVVGITAFAQGKEGRRGGKEKLTSEERVDFQVKRMTKDLGLNDKQAEQVKAIVTKQAQKRDAKREELKASKDKDRQEMRAKMEANQAEVSADMKKILTPEQFTKWEQNRDEKKEKMKEKMLERKEKK